MIQYDIKVREIKGRILLGYARPFRRDKRVSPNGAAYLYNHNAETYMEVGNALGLAVAELFGKQK